jgi:hypothetical protein
MGMVCVVQGTWCVGGGVWYAVCVSCVLLVIGDWVVRGVVGW